MAVPVFPLYDVFFSLPILNFLFMAAMGSTVFFVMLFLLEKAKLFNPVKHFYGDPKEVDVLFPKLFQNLGYNELEPLKIAFIAGLVVLIIAINLA